MKTFTYQVFLFGIVSGLLVGCTQVTSPVTETGAGPQIVSMSPSPTQSYFSFGQDFRVTFSEAMDPASVEENYRILEAGKPVVGTFHWQDDESVMIYKSEIFADSEKEFEVWMGQGMRSRWGQPLLGGDGQALGTLVFGCVSYGTPTAFETNGQRIYFTLSSDSNEPIVPRIADETPGPQMGYGGGTRYGMGRGMMQRVGVSGGRAGMACVSCHGPNGQGGKYLAMGTILTPDIRYSTLSSVAEDDGHAHEAYHVETLKQAITLGVKPDGDPLNILMPRWSISEGDLNDLIDFLKTL